MSGLGQYLFDVPFDRGLGQEELFREICVLVRPSATKRRISSWRVVSGACGSGSAAAGSERQLLKLDRSAFEVEGRCLKCFLGELGIGDVVGDPDHTDRLTGGIHHNFGSVDQRPHPAVSADDPVLERERRALRDRPLEGFTDSLSIVGVNVSLAAFEGLDRTHLGVSP